MSGSLSGFNIGSDTQLSLISGGAILQSSIITMFESRQLTQDLDSTGIDGVNRYRFVEKGWEGSFEYDRTDSALDDYFVNKENARYLFGSQPPVVQITETMAAVDGSLAKYRYDGVTLKLDSTGARKGDDKVSIKVSWRAGRRVKVL